MLTIDYSPRRQRWRQKAGQGKEIEIGISIIVRERDWNKRWSTGRGRDWYVRWEEYTTCRRTWCGPPPGYASTSTKLWQNNPCPVRRFAGSLGRYPRWPPPAGIGRQASGRQGTSAGLTTILVSPATNYSQAVTTTTWTAAGTAMGSWSQPALWACYREMRLVQSKPKT